MSRTGSALLLAIVLAAPSSALRPSGETAAEAARHLIDDGRYVEAERAAQKALSDAESGDGPDSRATADALDLLIEAQWRNSRCLQPESLRLARRAVDLRIALAGEEGPDAAGAILNLGRVEYLQGSHAAALADVRRALALRERSHVARDEVLVDILTELGYELVRASEFVEARRHLDRAVRTAEEQLGPEDPRLATALHRRANLARIEGDFQAARDLVDRALRIRRKALRPDHPHTSDSIGLLALLLSESGDYAGARPLYEEALDLLTRSYGPDDPKLGSAHYNLALFLMEIGDFAGALPHMEKSYQTIVSLVGTDHPDAAGSGHGRLLMEMGDYPAARRSLERSLRVRETYQGPDTDVAAFSAQALANLLTRMGDLEAAQGHLRHALAVFEKNHGPASPLAASALQDLGLIEEQRSNFSGGEALLVRAHAALAATLGPDHPKTGIALGHLARLRFRRGAQNLALDESFEAIGALRTSLVRTVRNLPERTALGYAATLTSLFDLPCTLVAAHPGTEAADRGAMAAPGDVTRLWDAVVRSRALVLDEMASRHRTALEHESPGLATLLNSLADTRSRLARFVSAEGASYDRDDYLQALRALVEAKERAESALADRSASFRSELAQRTVGLREVLDSLPPRSTLVSFVRYHDLNAGSAAAYLALIQGTTNSRPTVVPLGPAAALEDLIRRWRREVASPPDEPEDDVRYHAAAEVLRRAVWDPLATGLRGAERVFLVPDGALSLLNFATLPLADGRYLAESPIRIHTLSAERDAAAQVARRPPGHGLLLVGAPDFEGAASRIASTGIDAPRAAETSPAASYRGMRSACGEFRSIKFGPLPGSAAETDEISAIWQTRYRSSRGRTEPVIHLTGAEASEEAFKRSAAGKRILHLATHGFFAQDRCDSALDRADDSWIVPAGQETRGATTLENPLLLSGLAFAGANRRETLAAGGQKDDGILTAEEISSLDLRGVEWALLSACGTGLGPSQTGEGVLGLRRTFQVAGARTVLMSLWDVDDNMTRDWARQLYASRLGGRTTIEAVREAALALLAARREAGVSTHPFSWGAFVAAGDWR
jgi:CHAT domain-containing protein